MEYMLLEAKGPCKRLDTLVNETIEQGWRPQGGVVVTEGTLLRMWYTQAMVRDGQWTLEMD